MHRYATTTPEARELVAELEFVWDQIKGMEEGSSRSGESGGKGSGMRRRREYEDEDGDDGGGEEGRKAAARVEGLKVLRPVSDGDEVEDDDEDVEGGRFQDARIERRVFGGNVENGAESSVLPMYSVGDLDVRNRKWRRRMEQALVKLSVEIAALREQIERRAEGGGGRRGAGGVLGWVRWMLSVVVRHALFDGSVLLLLMALARKKGDRRLEDGLRMMYCWIREQLGRNRVLGVLKTVR